MNYIQLLLLGLKLLDRLTDWMERHDYIEQGIAQQVKANLEASNAAIEKGLKARAEQRARDADFSGVSPDDKDPNLRD